VVDGMLEIYTPHPFIPALMFAVSRDVVSAPATHGVREEGETTYTLGRMIALFANLLVNNSSLLLKTIGQLGLGVSALSFAYGGLVVFEKLAYDTQVAGWTSLMVVTLLIGGLLLFSLGVVGEYLIRIISAVEKKPTYWVRERRG
jgi:dolichol-phosphate mannosyltransferase/undecaprenyl-phosphate 4-deoxy-4-formamido-L-arabinose transferase